MTGAEKVAEVVREWVEKFGDCYLEKHCGRGDE